MDAESGAATHDWMQLQRSLIQLRMEIAETTDSGERADLVHQLREARATIAEIEKREREPAPELEPVAEAPKPGPATTATITNGGDASVQADVDNTSGRRWPLVLAASAAVIAVVGISTIVLSRSSSTDTAAADADGAEESQNPERSGGATVSDADTADDAATVDGNAPSDTTPTTHQPGLRVSLYDHRFSAQGGVSNQQTEDAIERAAYAAFGERSTIDIDVDNALDSPAWLSATPDLANELLLLIEGEIIVTGEETVVSGTATRQDRDRLLANLENSGLPPVSPYVDLVEPNPVELSAKVNRGTVILTGTLPDEATIGIIEGDLVAAFGKANVVVNVGIDETRVARSAIAGFGADVAALSNFPNVVVGLMDDSFFAVLDQGLEFEPGGSHLDPVAAGNLQGLLPLALRTTAPISIVGYTDSSGDDDDNHELSLKRAQEVTAVLLDAGIDPARISTTGLGDSNPIDSNETAEGRARNRRIVVTIG